MISPQAITPSPRRGRATPEGAAPPPLENGDRLTLAEFLRRYEAMPGAKAELIEGIVHMGSPVAYNRHAKPHGHILAWLWVYRNSTPGVDGGADGSVRLDLDNMAQPDAFLFIKPELGGRVRIGDDDYLDGTPELVVEVASSTVSYDLHAKLHVYRRQGTPEYVVWRTRDQAIDWFVLREGAYVRLDVGADGLYRSEVFPGLWLDPAAMIRDDGQTVARVARQGVDSPEHAAFVARLSTRGD